MLSSLLFRYGRALKSLSAGRLEPAMGIKYWEKRARKFGRRSVLNLQHSDSEFDSVTRKQEKNIFSFLKPLLKNKDKTILDLGCGPGRFTPGLAKLISGKAIGIDVVMDFLKEAPKADNLEYEIYNGQKIPLPAKSVNVIFTYAVLQVLPDDILKRTAKEMNRVLTDEGLIFLVENTTQGLESRTTKYRSVSQYKKILSFIKLDNLGCFSDCDEQMSVMAGRKI